MNKRKKNEWIQGKKVKKNVTNEKLNKRKKIIKIMK